MKRIQLSFSKGKDKKVKILANHNQELQEILGYSERIIPIAETRKSSTPVALFEKVRQHASCVHNALKRHWKCSNQKCRSHRVHLTLHAEVKVVSVNVLFIIEDGQGPYPEAIKQEVVIQPVDSSMTASQAQTAQISYVQQATAFTKLQKRIEDTKSAKRESSFNKIMSKVSNIARGNPGAPAHSKKQARFATPLPAIIISQHKQVFSPSVTVTSIDSLSFDHITDLCSSLRNCKERCIGVISDESDRQFLLSKQPLPSPVTTAPHTARLIRLPELLDAYHRAEITITRQHRFEMAFHIASALLQTHLSPWLSTKWSKHDIYFLADSQNLYSNQPYISQTFVSKISDASAPVPYSPSTISKSVSEEHSRASLFCVGVIVLELIFGQNIESCPLRPLYYGANNQPNEQTHATTARAWAKQVLGECGAEIADVVRRCLDCAFGPRPDFMDPRFREAIYECVIRPLGDYLKPWQVVMQ